MAFCHLLAIFYYHDAIFSYWHGKNSRRLRDKLSNEVERTHLRRYSLSVVKYFITINRVAPSQNFIKWKIASFWRIFVTHKNNFHPFSMTKRERKSSSCLEIFHYLFCGRREEISGCFRAWMIFNWFFFMTTEEDSSTR